MPKIARATSERPAPTRPASATISPALTENETSVNTPSRVSRSTLSTVCADLGDLLGEERVQVAADHRVDQLLRRRLGDRLGHDVAAVAHHGDALAEREDLVQPVRDEQHGRAAGAQRLDDAEEPVDLGLRERGRRLVHHDHARVGRERLGDLDDLLIGDREPARDAVGIELDAELVEEQLHLAPHAPPVDAPAAAQRLRADEDVLRDRQVGEERGLLEDDGDAGCVRLRGRVEDDLDAVQQHAAAVGPVHAGEDLDERGLAGAVLADERVRLAAAQLDPAVLERAHRAEALARVVDDEQGRIARRVRLLAAASGKVEDLFEQLEALVGPLTVEPLEERCHLALPARVHLGLLHRAPRRVEVVALAHADHAGRWAR